jgi:hypothetical protein
VTKQPDPTRPTLFVETNALHHLRFYLDFARPRKLWPYGPQVAWTVIKAGLKSTERTKNRLDGLHKGYASLHFLKLRTQDDCQVFISRISLAEITHGLVEGRAHFRMAESGMPYRMRQHGSELNQLVRACVTRSDFQQIRLSVNELRPDLDSLLGTTVTISERGRDVQPLLQVILENVYLDVIDGWLYAEALVEQADQILTFDGDFSRTINLIHNPSGDNQGLWGKVQASLRQEVAKSLMPSRQAVRKITLPAAVTMDQIGSLIPSVNA